MLARSTLGCWAATKTSTRDLPQLARFVHRTILARNASDLPVARALSRAYTSALQSRRSYATTTAATKPTATVKKAVKAQAASKAAPKKKAAASSKTAKKPAKKAAAARAKPKTRAKAKPKKAAPKKPAAKKRVRKELTDEQKLKAKIAELRKVALKAPVTPHQVAAVNVYIAEYTKGSHDAGSPSSRLSAASQAFKTLTPAEREHYNHLANERTAAKRAEYKAWIQSHTIEQIRLANNARAQLRTKLSGLGKSGFSVHTARLVDERQPKRPATAYAQFVGERYATGDLKGISVGEAGKIIGGEWKSLSASEKKKYEDAYAADLSEYTRELAEKGIETRASTKA